MAAIVFKNIVKKYGDDVTAVKDFNLKIQDKEFVVLVGPSGCGKSTLLRMIAGLEEITEGEMYIDDMLANEVAAKDRNIAMVFQNYALYPHMNVYKNMEFGLKMRKIPKGERDRIIRDTAKVLQIEELLHRKPLELSGGQKQRVALGRAMVRKPEIFLLDEPLSNLDAQLRTEMRHSISKLHNQVNTTFVYVTHDQTEAMTMADKIVVMKDGYIQQVDSPTNIYNNPANLFVAEFMGSPKMNILPAEIQPADVQVQGSSHIKEGDSKDYTIINGKDCMSIDGKACINIGGRQYPLPKEYADKATLESYLRKPLFAGFRAEDIDVNSLDIEQEGRLQNMCTEKEEMFQNMCTEKEEKLQNMYTEKEEMFQNMRAEQGFIDLIESLGAENLIHVLYNDHKLIAKISGNAHVEIGQKVFFRLNMAKMHLFDRETGSSLKGQTSFTDLAMFKP